MSSILFALPGIMERARNQYDALLTGAPTVSGRPVFSSRLAGRSCAAETEKTEERPAAADKNEAPSKAQPAAAEEPLALWNRAARDGQNHLVHGDNLPLLAEGIRSGRWKGICNLIYCDPPFFTRGDRAARIPVVSARCPEIRHLRMPAYDDCRRTTQEAYLEGLAVRLLLMRDALADTGSIFVHLDTRAVHAVKLLMDEIFGAEHFINEIIWTYKSGGAASRSLARKHDTILFYGKTAQYTFNVLKEKSYNREFKPYRFDGVEEFQDERGWYTMVRLKDVWQVDMVGRSARERLNYATQKPEALLERILAMATREGDLCADFFSGSGTLAACCARTGRRFLCADQTGLAIVNSMKRPLLAAAPLQVWQLVSTGSGRSGHSRASGQSSPLARRLRAAGSRTTGSLHLLARRRRAKGGALPPETDGSPEAAGPVKRDPEAAFHRLLQEDPLALVDFWCTGTVDPEGAFCCTAVYRRDGSGAIPTDVSWNGTDTHVWIAGLNGSYCMMKIEVKV